MTHKLPFSEILISGIRVKVSLADDAENAGELGEGGIVLRDGAKDAVAAALCHEIIEAWNYEYDLKLPHGKIAALEKGLYLLLRDAPEVGKFVRRIRW